MRPIGVGIIGASPDGGWAAAAHVPALRALPEYELRAVATSRPSSAQRAADLWGVDAFDDARNLIEHPDVDLVVVAVKVTDHHELLGRALSTGKMLFSEWPLGVGLDQAQDLADAAATAGVATLIGLQARFAPAVRTMRELIERGYIGRVLATTLIGSGQAWGPSTDSAHAYLFDARNGATTLSVSIGHALDAVTHVLGDIDSITSTIAVGRDTVRVGDDAVIPVTAPDQIAITAGLRSGAVASVFYRGGLSRAGDLRWEVNGTDGDLLVSSPLPNGNLQAIELVLAGANGAATRVVPIDTPDRYPELGLAGPAQNVANLYRAFAHDQQYGTAEAPSFSDAVALHQLLAAIEHGSL
ncbi:Gfo/Idh/MocA family oxidoreductase [Nocardia sp. NPDC049220]|uniref:Gfo/Idh/MocA family protein n=1 Tax=Nocardia sp. NPDC049220 TaxID=3155273 RepID=UPI0033FB3473